MNFLYRLCLAAALTVVWLSVPIVVSAEEVSLQEDFLELWEETTDLAPLDEFAREELGGRETFRSLVEKLITEEGTLDWKKVLGSLTELVLQELRQLRPLFLRIFGLALLFSICKGMFVIRAEEWENLGFFVVYTAILVWMLQSFVIAERMVEQVIDRMLSFMTAFVPVYAASLMLTGKVAAAGVFYQMTFALIYLIQLGIRLLLLPGVKLYVTLRLADQLLESKLTKLAGLIESAVKFVLRSALLLFTGLGAIESLLSSARDQVTIHSVSAALRGIPGIGNTFGAASDLLISCGALIRSGIGVAALVVMAALVAAPFLKILCFYMMYRLMAALIEPIADGRIAGTIAGVGQGCELYVRTMLTAVCLFFLAVALVGGGVH